MGYSFQSTGCCDPLGDGGSYSVEVSPSSLDFGEVEEDDTSASKSLELSNTGWRDVLIKQVLITGPYLLQTPVTSNSLLKVGEKLTLQVAFAPTAPGLAYGSLVFDFGGNPTTITTILTGVGVNEISGPGEDLVVQRVELEATAGQTSFATPESYAVGYMGVYLNGVRLSEQEFTATDGLNVILGEPAQEGDIVVLDGFLSTGSVTWVPQPANPDTSGATLAELETEVNELKAALRAFNIILPA